MKKTKLITILLLMAVIISIFTINVSAADESTIGIKVNGFMEYYPYYFSNEQTWQTLINAYNNGSSIRSFGVLRNVVVFERYYVTLGETSIQSPATNVSMSVVNKYGPYYEANPLYTVENNVIRFAGWLPSESPTTYGEFLSVISQTDPECEFTSGGYYGNYHWYFRGGFIYKDEACTIELTESDAIIGGVDYYLDVEDVCSHSDIICVDDSLVYSTSCTEDAEVIYKCRNCGYVSIAIRKGEMHSLAYRTLVESTCNGEGSYEVYCSDCDYSETYSSSALGHDMQLIETIPATCDSTGMERFKCSRCNERKDVLTDRLIHQYSEATCSAPITCKLCGTQRGEAIGHDYNVLGKCKMCGEKSGVGSQTLSSWGASISTWWNGSDGTDSDDEPGAKDKAAQAAQSAVDYIIEKGEQVLEEIKGLFTKGDDPDGMSAEKVWEIVLYCLAGIPIIILVYFGIKYGLKIITEINKNVKKK